MRFFSWKEITPATRRLLFDKASPFHGATFNPTGSRRGFNDTQPRSMWTSSPFTFYLLIVQLPSSSQDMHQYAFLCIMYRDESETIICVNINCRPNSSKSNIPYCALLVLQVRATFVSADETRASGVNLAHMSRKCYAQNSRTMCVM
jgi:hypothetical protein